MLSQLHRFLLVILLLSACQWGERRTGQQGQVPQAVTHSPQAIDTAAVFQILSFNSSDSALIYLPGPNPSYSDEAVSFYFRQVISHALPAFDIRAVLSVRETEKVADLGSYVIIYRHVDSMNVSRIHKDSIEIYVGSLSGTNLEITFVDFNYDGYKDIVVSFSQNTSGKMGFNSFLRFDPSPGQFVPDRNLNDLFSESEIYINANSRTITEGGRIGIAGYSGIDYLWNDTTYAPFSRINTEFSHDAEALVTTKEQMRDGKWVIVSRDTSSMR